MGFRELSALPHRIASGFNWNGQLLRRTAIQLARRHPRSSIALTAAVAGTGYGFVLLFPYLLYSMPQALSELAPAAHTPRDWLMLGVQATSLALGAIVTHTLLRLRFGLPAGRPLTRDEAPRLYQMLADLSDACGTPAIHAVLLDDGLDVRVVHAPRSGLSPFTRRTLIIGLPVLQTVAPAHLRVLLARCIGQYSPRSRVLGIWLHHLNDIWQQYAELRNHGSAPARLIGLFFSAYAPLYRTISLGIARRAELHADSCALTVINDQETVEGISFHAASRDFLTTRYWPTIERMAARNDDKEKFLPYRHMTEVTLKGLDAANLDATLTRLYNEEDGLHERPGFAERLENIGHARPVPLRAIELTAASCLLERTLPEIVGWFDKRWLRERSPVAHGSADGRERVRGKIPGDRLSIFGGPMQ